MVSVTTTAVYAGLLLIEGVVFILRASIASFMKTLAVNDIDGVTSEGHDTDNGGEASSRGASPAGSFPAMDTDRKDEQARNMSPISSPKANVNIDGNANNDDSLVILQAQESKTAAAVVQPLTYWVSQKLIFMGMGWMYFLAFYGAYRQNEGLMGDHGLVPSKEWFEGLREKYECTSSSSSSSSSPATENWQRCFKGFVDFPSVFWWFDFSDENNTILLLVGMTLSLLCAFGRSSSMATWLLLWILYFSVVTSAGGTAFYAYGWESQVLETGFLCAFLCQHWVVWPNRRSTVSPTTTRGQPPNYSYSASPLVLWLFRWLSFRIAIGAGMIKIRGDSCWTQKTCLLYHFETQPIPSPLSFVFHFLPAWMLQRAVDLDLLVQVYTSWFVLLPTVRVGLESKYSRKRKSRLLQKIAGSSLVLVRLGGYIQGFV